MLEPIWECLECGAQWLDEEIRIDDECPGCACRFKLVLMWPFD